MCVIKHLPRNILLSLTMLCKHSFIFTVNYLFWCCCFLLYVITEKPIKPAAPNHFLRPFPEHWGNLTSIVLSKNMRACLLDWQVNNNSMFDKDVRYSSAWWELPLSHTILQRWHLVQERKCVDFLLEINTKKGTFKSCYHRLTCVYKRSVMRIRVILWFCPKFSCRLLF